MRVHEGLSSVEIVDGSDPGCQKYPQPVRGDQGAPILEAGVEFEARVAVPQVYEVVKGEA